jgi:hypothetical protein
MNKITRLSLFSLFLTLAGGLAAAQSTTVPVAAASKYYKADFLVKEFDATGHVANTRSYSTVLATDNSGAPKQIRSGDKFPIQTSGDEKGDVKYQYIDLGVNIDCRYVHELDQKLAFSVTAEVSSVPAGTDPKSSLGPLIRQFKWNADVLIAPGVPTTIFSSDDVGSKSKIQVEITATPVR